MKPSEAADALRRDIDDLVGDIVDRHHARSPDLARYGPDGRKRCAEDARRHLEALAEAVDLESTGLFADYVGWVGSVLSARGIPITDLREQLAVVGEVAAERGGQGTDRLSACLEAGLARLDDPSDPVDFLDGAVPEAHEYAGHILAADRQAATAVVEAALESGRSIRDIYLGIFEPFQREVGRLWQLGRISVAQEHYCTAATQMIMSQLYPRLFAGRDRRRRGRMVAACVEGELHEIGLRMVTDLCEIDGWDTLYLGASTPPAGVVDLLESQRADVLAVSTTLTSHLGRVGTLIEAVRERSTLGDLAILVGGRPFLAEPGLHRAMGADATASDAGGAVEVARRLASEGRSG